MLKVPLPMKEKLYINKAIPPPSIIRILFQNIAIYRIIATQRIQTEITPNPILFPINMNIALKDNIPKPITGLLPILFLTN